MVGEEALRDIPEGSGWLMARFAGDTREQADERADRLLRDVHRSEHDPRVAYIDDPEAELRLWKVREAGLGATAYPPGGRDTHEGGRTRRSRPSGSATTCATSGPCWTSSTKRRSLLLTAQTWRSR
nr:hypothetical protein [Actinomadura decatromicini]